MKKYSLRILVLAIALVGVFTIGNVQAQSKKEKKVESKVKILVEKDGKMVKVDTTFTHDVSRFEIIELLHDINLPDSVLKELEDVKVWSWHEGGKRKPGVHKHRMLRAHHSGCCCMHSCGPHSNRVMKYKIEKGEGEHRIFIESFGDEDVIHPDDDAFFKGLKGKNSPRIIFIEKGDEVEETVEGDVRVIKIRKKTGDVSIDLDETVEVEVTIDEENKTSKKKRKKRK